MSYNQEKYLRMLELDKILEKLSDEATLSDAKTLCLDLTPDTNIDTISGVLKNTSDAYMLIARYAAPSFGAVKNVSAALTRAGVGAVLTIRELLDISEVLRVIRSVKTWRADCKTGTGALSVEPLFDALTPNKYFEDKIAFAVKSEDELNDKASSTLYDIRRKITSNSAKIRDILDKIVRSGTSKYLQEAIITQRDGRFVVPVKAEHRHDVPGIVHDTSSTGSTVFIEPMSVVETNNDIRVLQSKELDEINRILAELSAEVAGFADNIKVSYDALVELNFIFAKAHLAYKMKASMPLINQNAVTYLKRARHPLIHHKSVVPVTIALGKEYDILVITGPNTGGKTVALKTIGLLTLMTMCGLMIPADDGSEVAVYGKIFADIGDEQSIEQSLSTFSSHMVNIVSILNEADSNSLVLFDELCAGTDPVEGAVLAKSILMKLTSLGCKIAATTHYPELKSYAIDTERVENACCEFDVATLKPTYRLIIGMPGRSNAFAISKRLGLDDSIIEEAKAQISEHDLRFEQVVSSLEQARQSAETEQQKVLSLRARLDEAKRKSDLREQEFTLKQEKLMEQTREKANHIIEDARYKASLLINELEEMKKSFNADTAAKLTEKARAEYKRTLKELVEDADPIQSGSDTGEKLSAAPAEGDTVFVTDIGQDAMVMRVKANQRQAYVASGSIKVWVSFDHLRAPKGGKKGAEKKTRNVTGMASRAERSVSGEVDIRGMAADEGILELDRYIDQAVLSGITTITVIHGKGTGVLRKAVQQHLRSHRNIKTYRTGLFGEGENGVTIAEINQ